MAVTHLPKKEVSERVAAILELFPQLPPRLKQIADHVYSLRLGKVAFSGPAAALADDKAKLKELFL